MYETEPVWMLLLTVMKEPSYSWSLLCTN